MFPERFMPLEALDVDDELRDALRDDFELSYLYGSEAGERAYFKWNPNADFVAWDTLEAYFSTHDG